MFGSQAQIQPTPSPSTMHMQTVVRAYGSEQEILNAYYVFIHTYFPFLPPRVTPLLPDRPLDYAGSYVDASSEQPVLAYRPCSPLSLAISAILSLAPHPNDPEPSSTSSKLQRRSYAHTFAQMAISSVEEECELQSSSTDPSQGLSDERPLIDRDPFHPRTPVELESLLSLLVLSTYEYTQRGNLRKMRSRAGQALATALDMSLHSVEEHDEFSEARRRAWWMTYYCVLQGSIVSTTAPSIVVQDSQYTTSYPYFSSDPDGWSIFIQAQQVLVSATQFILDLNKCIKTGTNMPYIYERMQQLDAWANSVLAQAILPPNFSQPHSPDDKTELITARSIRTIAQIKLSSARIKIHRFRAFSDLPIFMRKHCDLSATTHPISTSPQTPNSSSASSEVANIQCQCNNLEQSFYGTSLEFSTSSTSTAAQYPFSECPFTTHHSAKICLGAALVISRMFHSLPIPKPLVYDDNHDISSGHQQQQLPRTMPSFACCLMQGSYAMLMIFYKARVTRVRNQSPSEFDNTNNTHPSSATNERKQRMMGSDSSDRLVGELRQGVERIIGAVRNYTIAFEALEGMRDEIERAYNTVIRRFERGQ